MNNEPIENLGKGALPDPLDDRDFKFTPQKFGSSPIDWSKEFRLPEPPNENQHTSSSCVGQGGSYYHWQLHRRDYSRRDLYADIALIGGGAYVRDGVARIVSKGQATRDEVSDPVPQTEAGMANKTGLKDEYRLSDIEANYFSVGDDIEAIATTIRDYNGVLFGLNGDNAGWIDKTNPKPPKNVEWGHAIYGMGYHKHGSKKCIIAKSSWCKDGHHEHHIKEGYFNSGNMFNGWTLIPKEQFMFRNLKVKVISDKGEAFGVYTSTPNTDLITKAEDESEWRSYSKQDSYAVHTVNQDGSTDWAVDKIIDLR